MRTFEFGPSEAEVNEKLSEQDNEKAALEALIDYAIECAMDGKLFAADERLENARQHLCKAVL